MAPAGLIAKVSVGTALKGGALGTSMVMGVAAPPALLIARMRLPE
jgi:hypothetical protein